MNTLHRISQADILAALENNTGNDADNIVFDLAVSGNWTGEGRIDFSAPNGSSTGPFPDINEFSFVATSSFGTAEFTAVDLAFTYWSVGPSGLMTSFSVLTNPVNGFSLSIQLGEDGAKLEGRKFATLEAGTLTHSGTNPGTVNHFEQLQREFEGAPFLRRVK